MRQKRAKQYRKLLSSYIRTFGLRPPIQILIDSEMANSLASMKLTSEEVLIRLESTFQVSAALPAGVKPQSLQYQQQQNSRFNDGNSQSRKSSTAAAYVKPMITQCSIVELYAKQKEGENESRAVDLAKNWERRFCNHKDPLPGDRCIRSVIGDTNKHRYALAVNSSGLRNAIRHTVAGVPVVHVNDHKVMVMEPMSDLTRKRCEEMEREKLQAISGGGGGERQSNVLGKRASSDSATAEGEVEGENNQTPLPPRKKKAKGPNPLSMKKSKKDKAAKQQQNSTSSKAQKAKATA